ncbi:probable NOT transcription complex subunit VIP2 [Cryptomeria japonica]|uniref:probable NOT transcription complex subunit VIP2 n=1 Tax=Cryptomeria japonica TaxID=3369 RepID=UPI0027D9FC6D|nr:probable NOT transcription complex subunit VIP2 [Cryptomeria japonica]
MASRRTNGSFQLYRGHSTGGGNQRPSMDILQQQQQQRHRFHQIERPTQGIPLPGIVYTVQSQAFPFMVPFNTCVPVAYLPTLQTSYLFPPFYTALPMHTQVIPNPISNNRVRQTVSTTVGSHNSSLTNTVGSHNQFNHNLQPKSVVGEMSERKEEDVEAASYGFGLMGLRDVINGTDSNVTTLAMGRDKDTLNSYDNLYCSHNFPWSARIPNPQPQYKLPSCYLRQVPKLHKENLVTTVYNMFPSYIADLNQDTLFFIFYSTPNDEAQLLAANELHNRDWLYHKQLRVWLKHNGSEQPKIKTNTYEKGSYVYFDPHKWSYIEKEELTVFYDKLEKRPSLPPHEENQL